MATTEEIVAKYRLDLDDLKKQVNELQGEMGKVDKKATETSGNVDKAFSKLGDKLKDLGKAVLAAFAVERIVAFGKASVQAFAESEAGALKLRSAVSASGGLQKDFDNLNKQAEELAGITIFDDDTIKAAQTLALQFGLNASAVSKLIPKVADFAAATGQDLPTALQAVLGGINGQVDGLKRYGFQLDTTATRNERFAAVVDQLTGKFEGQAAALTETLGGAIGQSEKAFGELQEAIGAALAPAITKTALAATELIEAFTPKGPSPVQQLEEQKLALNRLQLQLQQTNLSQQDRIKIIAELQANYGPYLKNLNLEKMSNEELAQTLAGVNNQLLNKVVLAREDERIAKAKATAEKFVNLQLDREEQALTAIVKAQEAGIKLSGKSVDLQSQLAEAIGLLEPIIKKQGNNFSLTASKEAIALSNLKNAQNNLTLAQQDAKVATDALIKSEVNKAEVAKRLGLSTQEYRTLEIQTLQKLVAEGDKLAAQEIKRRDLQLEVDKLTLDQFKALSEARKKEIETVLGTTTAAIEEAKRTGLETLTDQEKKLQQEKAKATADAAARAQAAAEKQAADELKLRQDLAKQELAQDQANLATYDADRRRAIETRYNNEEQAAIEAAQAAQARLLVDLQQGLITWEEYEKRKAEITAQVASRDPEKRRALLQQDIDTLQQQIQNRKDYGQDVTDLETQLKDKQAALQTQITTDEQAASQQRIKNAEDEAKVKLDAEAKVAEERKKLQELAYQDAVNLVGQLFELNNQRLEQELADVEARQTVQQEEADAAQAALDQQLAAKIISQQQYEQKREALDQQRAKSEQLLAAETARIKRKQDANAKLQAIFRLGIDTAQAIVAQLKEVPLPAGAPLLALLGGIAAAQLAAILAAKPPQYAQGVDWVPLGNNKRGRDTIPAMLDEGERVVSRRQNLKHWELYQAIDEDRLPQYIFNKYTAPALEKERASGGALARALTQSISLQQALGSTAPDNTELRRLWRRGVTINNLDELAELIKHSQPSPYRN